MDTTTLITKDTNASSGKAYELAFLERRPLTRLPIHLCQLTISSHAQTNIYVEVDSPP